MDNKRGQFYLRFPIFQIIYILFWIPSGYLVSCFLSALIMFVSLKILSAVLYSVFSFAFEMFMLSGIAEGMLDSFYFAIVIVLDLIFLLIGLGLINKTLDKKKDAGQIL